jgi:Tol biopolymer transport system component/imidazolonepropionase-like amidohydrolase
MHWRGVQRSSTWIKGAVAILAFAAVTWLSAQGPASTRLSANGNSTLALHEGTMIAIALSPDKQTLAMDLQGTLFTLPAKGGQATRITDELFDARQPDWSPDGASIAFQSNRNGLIHIWVAKRDGSGAHAITSGDFEDREPHWSPDGTRIAFSSDRSGNYDIWEVNVASGQLRQITKNPANDFSPTWSPDGSEIAFVSTRQPSPGVYAIRADGTSERLIEAVSGAGPGFGRTTIGTPSWNPDGKRVLYSTISREGAKLVFGGQTLSSNEDLFPFRAQWISPTEFLYSADGKIKRRSIASDSSTPIEFTANLNVQVANYNRKRRDFDSKSPRKTLGIVRPVISPDGKQVAFVAVGDVWVMKIGSKPERLTNDTSAKVDPAWSPDGSQLVYSSDRSGSFNLWIRNMRTGSEKQVTDVTNAEMGSSWSPDGTRIAYVDSTGDMEGAIEVLDVKTGRSKKIHDATFGPGYPAWSADGRVIVISSLKQDSSRFREGSNAMWAIPSDGSDAGHLIVPVPHRSIGSRLGEGPVWSPDGKQMAFEMEGALWVMPVSASGDPAGPPRQLVKDPVDYLNWTGDSKHVFYLSVDRLKLVSTQDGHVQDIPLDLTWTEDIPSGRLVVHAGRLVDGIHPTARTNVDIVVEGNRIRSIEPHRADLHTGRVVDASNLTVMPGLIEAHSHYIDTNGSLYGRLLLAYGITTARSPGGKPSEVIEQREAFESGRRLGPRIYLTGHLLEGPRVYYPLAEPVTTEAQVDAAIDRADRLQFDLVKTYVKMPEPLRKRAVEAAHRAGIAVSSHELYPAAMFGMDSVEHFTGTAGRGYVTKVSLLGHSYQDVIEILSKSKMTITPTLSLGGFYPEMMHSDPSAFEDPRWRIQPSWVRNEASRRGFGQSPGQLQSALAMERAGVRIVTGTDSPLVPYGLSFHNDMEQEAEAGLTPFQVLQTATVNTAALLNASADLGSIEVGKLADMVVVDGDPLADISNARKVRRVIKNGEVIELQELLNPANRSTQNSQISTGSH